MTVGGRQAGYDGCGKGRRRLLTQGTNAGLTT